MTIKLHHIEAGPPDGRVVLLLHGLFGTGSNLGSVARALKQDYRVFSVDLPDHGKSDWLAAASIGQMADAVVDWMDAQNVSEVTIVGHSLGGKVAMQLALNNPARVAALCIADIAPVQYSPHHDAILTGLSEVVAQHSHSRAEADSVLAITVDEVEVRQFLLKSLKRNQSGQYKWQFNLEGIVENYAAILAAPTASKPFSGPTLFIKGEQSQYILPAHIDSARVLFPNAEFTTMRDSGHWLHAEHPDIFNGLVRQFLSHTRSVEDR